MKGTGRMNITRGLALGVCLLLPAGLSAQPRLDDTEDERHSATYIKGGVAHWQGDLENPGSLTGMSVDLFFVGYSISSAAVAIEHYFGDAAGFSVGYRKDGLGNMDAGHMFTASLFGAAHVRITTLKFGGGVEWGLPSLNFDVTKLEDSPDGSVRYRHTHPERNTDVPFVGTDTDGVLYPFLELSALERRSIFLFEAGMRFNIIGFHFDDYEVTARDEVRHDFVRKKVLVPSLFANVGIRLF
jgi:hypothetical protein